MTIQDWTGKFGTKWFKIKEKKKGGPEMDKENSVKHFTELSEVELDKVVGGNSIWDEIVRRFLNKRVNPTKHNMT